MHLYKASRQQELRENRTGDGRVKSRAYEDVDIAATGASWRRPRGPHVKRLESISYQSTVQRRNYTLDRLRITLHWTTGNLSQWKEFVRNRVTEI